MLALRSPLASVLRRAIARRLIAVVLAGMTALPSTAAGQGEKVDATMVARIRDEGMARSQVMDHISWLADVYGPRLTGSTNIEQAGAWAMKSMRSWGLANVHDERWAFGKGWSLQRFSATLLAPQVQPLIALPKAWSPGTNGNVTADVVRPVIESEPDFAKYRGTLRGKIVLTQPLRAVRMLDGRIVLRMTDKDIAEAMTEAAGTAAPAGRGGGAGAAGGRTAATFQRQIDDFYKAEGVVALLDRGADADSSAGGSDLSWFTQRVDGGTIFVGAGGTRDSTAGTGLPTVTLAVEHYNRMVRVLEKKVPVRMQLDIGVQFLDETTPRGFNIIAEIPGTDPKLKDEYVLIGSHFDSWHGGTGATDNATGSGAMMEAMRILTAINAKPRRTIRIALWGGEEEGLLGSNAYAREHLGDVRTMELKPEQSKIVAYYNIDNGTGKIRGVWMQGNKAIEPVFRAFTAPLADLGVTILGPRSVASTDHTPFDALGIPAFQFVQERYEYNSRTHHSNMDVVDRVQAADMKQMATVVATMAYLTAMRDQPLPRKPLPAARPRGN